MKVLGTNTFLYGKYLERMKELGYTGTHGQFRIICKCRGMADANRKCKELGMHDKIFHSGWCAETGNSKELEICEKDDIWISINGTGLGNEYVSAKEIFAL